MSYSPNEPPATIDFIPQYLREELLRIAGAINKPDLFTQAQLLDKSSLVNSARKQEGLQVWDSTNKQPLWASGNTPTSTWVDGTGTVVHTPV